MTNKHKVIFIGDSRKMKGGVSTVIKTLEESVLWDKYNCYWLETQINSQYKLTKLLYLIRGLIKGLFLIPKYKIVHFHTAPGASMRTLFPLFFYSLVWHRKIIVQLHVGNQIKQHVNDKLFIYWTTHTDYLIFLGKIWKDEITPFLRKNVKTEFVYNPILEHEIQKINKKYFLYAAFFNLNKGYDILLKAFSNLVKDNPEWKLVMCGTGDVSGILECINKYHLNDKVILPGWIDGKDKETLFKEAYAYCMTSYQEGLPMSVLEAMSYGVPVITTPVGCIPEILQDNKTCLYFNFGDAKELEEKMRLLINNKKLRDTISINSYELSNNTFSLDTIAKKLDKIYSLLIK